MKHNKANSYMFWLTEYKNRHLMSHVGENAVFLCELFFQASWILNQDKYSKYTAKQIRYSVMQDTVCFIIEEKLDYIIDSEEMVKKYGRDLRIKIESMKHEVEKLTEFIRKNDTIDLQLFLDTKARVVPPEEIIKQINLDRLYEIDKLSLYYDDIVFCEAAFAAFDHDGLRILSGDVIPITNGKIKLTHVEIDLSAKIEDILADVVLLVCEGRESAACEGLLDVELNSLLEKGCPGYGPCAGGSCEKLKGITRADVALRRGKSLSNGYNYDEKSDAGRAAGLWLWEYMNEKKYVEKKKRYPLSKAIREIKNQDFIASLGFADSEEKVLRRWYDLTKKCIGEGKVLKMKASKS